jgi:hypothetical protein
MSDTTRLPSRVTPRPSTSGDDLSPPLVRRLPASAWAGATPAPNRLQRMGLQALSLAGLLAISAAGLAGLRETTLPARAAAPEASLTAATLDEPIIHIREITPSRRR